MRKKLLIFACLLAGLFIFAPEFSQTFAQAGKDKEVKAQRGAASRGEAKDQNITEEESPNKKDLKVDPPASKGGKARGGGCQVRLDNWTKWVIKIFVDGKYQGTVGRYGEGVTYATPGRVKVYARADFDDGSFLYWGPDTYNCSPNQYIYFKMVE